MPVPLKKFLKNAQLGQSDPMCLVLTQNPSGYRRRFVVLSYSADAPLSGSRDGPDMCYCSHMLGPPRNGILL